MYYSIKRLNKTITINNVYINLKKKEGCFRRLKCQIYMYIQYICISQHIS